MRIASGHSRIARVVGIALPTPNCRASYEAVVTTDRGPFVGGREFDLSPAVKSRLGFGSTGTLQVAH